MTCPHKIKECKCSKIPLEGGNKRVDILFITEFPGKTETKEKKYLVGAPGKFFREILRVMKDKTGFTYAISGVTRSISKPGVLVHSSPEVKACLHNLEDDVKRCKPKVIVLLGNLAYTVFSKHNILPKHGSSVEDGRLQIMRVFGDKYPVMYCQHPTWYLHNEACAVGILYRNIAKAIDYAKHRINPNIPNDFKTVTLTTLGEVKEALTELSQIKDFTAIDTEGANLNRVYGAKTLSIQLCADGKVGYLIPYLHRDSTFLDQIPKLNRLLTNYFFLNPTKTLGYLYVNAKHDYHQFFRDLKKFTFNAPIIDASFGEYSLEENLTRVHSFPKQKGPYSLFTMTYNRGFRFYSKTDSKEKRTILDKLPIEDWQEYAAADVVSLWHVFKKQIQEAERANYREGFLFLNCLFENHLTRSLTYAEHCGLSLNANKVRQFLASDSVIQAGIKDVMDRFYELPSVQEANKRVSTGKVGIATGLAGTVKTWTPSSPKHRELLYFDIMGLDPVNEEDDGDNSHTGKTFQKNYTGIHEVDLLVEYMSFSKMHSGFIKPMAAYLDSSCSDGSVDMYTDNRARTRFYPLAVTGRIRSSNPNTQQRPAGRSKAAKEILSMYEPPKGRIAIKVDYATFEVRGSGFLSDDKVMTKSFQEMHNLKEEFRANPKAFRREGYNLQRSLLDAEKKALKRKKQELADSKGVISKKKWLKAKEALSTEIKKYKKDEAELEDWRENNPIKLSKLYVEMMTDSHRKFASMFFKIPLSKVTKAQRQAAKALVFGGLYGMSIGSIAKSLKITEEEAEKMHKKQMAAFPYAAKWLNKSRQFGRKHFFVQSPLGRRRRLWGHLRLDKSIAGKMDRYAGNTVIQGVCSDNNIIAGSLVTYVIEAHEKLKYQVSEALYWAFTNLVHDSGEFEVPLEDAYYFIREFEKIFTDYLVMYLRKVFGFDIKIPLEVDFTIGTNYGNMRDWDGSEENLVDIMKWLCEETAKRDKTKLVDYKTLVNSPLYKQYKKGFVKGVIKDVIDQDLKTVKRLGLHIGEGGTK